MKKFFSLFAQGGGVFKYIKITEKPDKQNQAKHIIAWDSISQKLVYVNRDNLVGSSQGLNEVLTTGNISSKDIVLQNSSTGTSYGKVGFNYTKFGGSNFGTSVGFLNPVVNTKLYFPALTYNDTIATRVEVANDIAAAIAASGGGGTPQGLQEVTVVGNTTDRPIISTSRIEASAILVNNLGYIQGDNLTEQKSFQLPDKNGTFAMLDDILPVTQNLDQVTDNGNTTTNPINVGAINGIIINDLEGSGNLFNYGGAGFTSPGFSDGNTGFVLNTQNITVGSQTSYQLPAVSGAFVVSASLNGGTPIIPDTNGKLNITLPSTTGLVPYTGATTNVDLGTNEITAKQLNINSNLGGVLFTLGGQSSVKGSGGNLNLASGGNTTITAGSGLTATANSNINLTATGTPSIFSFSRLNVKHNLGFQVEYNGGAAKNVITSFNGQTAGLDGAITYTVGSGTVTSVTGTGGVTVASGTTTPVIGLGNITPTTVAASGTVTGSNLSGNNTGDNATNTTSNTYADGKVADVITDGVTTIAPSQNAVFDLAVLKGNLTGGNTWTGNQVFNSEIQVPNGLGIKNSQDSNRGFYRTGTATLGNWIYYNVANNTFALRVTNDNAASTGNLLTLESNISGTTAIRAGVTKEGRTFGADATASNDYTTLSQINNMYAVNTTINTTQNAAALNAAYPSAIIGFRLVAPNVGTGMMYIKTSAGGQWIAFNGSTLNP
jgi:hypothetical protein